MQPSTATRGQKKASGVKQVSNYSPEMENLLRSLVGGAQGGVGGGLDFLSKLASGDQSMFEEMERPAYAAFEKLLGQTGSRFSDLGARDSSYFENAVAGQGQELAQNLQAQRLGIRSQATNQLLQQAMQMLGLRPFENVEKTKSPGFDWGGLLGGIGGAAAGSFFGPLGTAAGGAAGKSLFGQSGV